MQGDGSTCDCTFSALLHIALCMCFAFFVYLPGGAFCFASHPQISVGSPLLVWGTQFFHCLPSTVYPPLPALDSSPLFFNETGARSSVSSAKNNFFAGAPAIFHMAFFFCQLNDTVRRVGAWVGCKGFFAGCGGPERTSRGCGREHTQS